MSRGDSSGRTLRINTIVFAFILLIIVISIATTITFFMENDTLKGKVSGLESELNVTEHELVGLNDSYHNLQSSFRKLKKNHTWLQKRYKNLTTKNEELVNQVESSLSKMKYFNEEIDDAISWFSENSDLDNAGLKDSQKDMLPRKCFSIEDDQCTIRSGCSSLFIDEYLDMHYREDFDAHWDKDKLLSLEEFYENSGGDCEDYSLFVKAIFNSFLEECNTQDKTVTVKSFSFSQGDDDYFLDKGDKWYYPDVTLLEFTDYVYPVVVCGSLMDPNAGERSGHCVNALTKNPVHTLKDLDEFEDAILFESQTGEFRGSFKTQDYESLRSHKLMTTKQGVVSYIITDTDQFIYSEEFGKWMSYASLNTTLSPVMDDLEATLERYGVDPDTVGRSDNPFAKDSVTLEGEEKELCLYDVYDVPLSLRQVYYYPKSGKTRIDEKQDAYIFQKIALNETGPKNCVSIRTEDVDTVGKLTVMVNNTQNSVFTDIVLYKEDLEGVQRLDMTI